MAITGDTDTPRPVKIVQAPSILWRESPPWHFLGNLLKGIDYCLGAAWSVVPVR